jgi:murein DD-endopeptidase MepM/ murein hydrolase activator NlpD
VLPAGLARALAARQTPTCRAAVGSSDYVNPLAGAQVKPERIDQGVDYAGTGTLAAIGAARITYVGTHGTGWPGAFIAYQLLNGVDRGCYVYYAEGVDPVSGLHVGQTVPAGQPIASIIPGWSTGIELGWSAGLSTVTSAATLHQWSARSDADSIASPAGKSFSALIAALGGPAGKVEG